MIINDNNAKWVLLLEDEEHLRTGLKRKLERAKYGVVECENLSQARFKLTNQIFDLLIFDVKLPDGTSEDLIKKLRISENELNFTTPILVISAHMDKELVESVRSEIQGALVKPFTGDEFMSKVERMTKSLQSS